jgi:hypothetical protein
MAAVLDAGSLNITGGATDGITSGDVTPGPSPLPFINFTYAHGAFNFTLPESARQRSVRNLGQSERFRVFLRKLRAGEPVRVVVFGGSVTCGNGLAEYDRVSQQSLPYKRDLRFSAVFEKWLQNNFPVMKPAVGAKVDPGFAMQHEVVNKCVSSTDTCFLARTLLPHRGELENADLVSTSIEDHRHLHRSRSRPLTAPGPPSGHPRVCRQ